MKIWLIKNIVIQTDKHFPFYAEIWHTELKKFLYWKLPNFNNSLFNLDNCKVVIKHNYKF